MTENQMCFGWSHLGSNHPAYDVGPALPPRPAYPKSLRPYTRAKSPKCIGDKRDEQAAAMLCDMFRSGTLDEHLCFTTKLRVVLLYTKKHNQNLYRSIHMSSYVGVSQHPDPFRMVVFFWLPLNPPPKNGFPLFSQTHVANQNPVPPVTIPIPVQIGSKLGGARYLPTKMGSQNGFDNHSQATRPPVSSLPSEACLASA